MELVCKGNDGIKGFWVLSLIMHSYTVVESSDPWKRQRVVSLGKS